MKYEIWGGNMDSLSFYDGGPAYHLDECSSIDEAREILAVWHKQNYAAWIQDKETQEIVK